MITTSTSPSLKPGTDIQFFPFPNIETANSDAVELGGDFAVAFANNDLSKKFMQWLARPETAKLWAQVGVIDPNKNADASALPNVASLAVLQFCGSGMTCSWPSCSSRRTSSRR